MSIEKRDYTKCAHCGQPKCQHYAVNYSDGPHVSGETLICPTSTFLRANEPKKAKP